MAYRHNDALYKHKKREGKFRKFTIFVVSISLICAGFVVVDLIINKLSNSNTVVSSENISEVQSASINVYRTEYYQFQAPDDWTLISSQSTDKKFVYFKESDISSQRLIIYINREKQIGESGYANTHVLPVNFSTLGKFTDISEVSDNCDSSSSWNNISPRNPSRIVHKNVEFVCTYDSKEYNVIVGEYGKDEVIEYVRPDGSVVTFTIVFSDLTAYPSPGDLDIIISSFTAF